MLNLKSLLTQILNNGIFKSGVTMTGQIVTSFKSFIGFGSYTSTQSSITNFASEVKLSSGAMGSVTLSSADTSYGATLPAGTYRFLFIPHRSGGTNGAAVSGSDNCNYNNIILINTTTNRMYIVHSNNKSGTALTEIREVNTCYCLSYHTSTQSYPNEHPTATSNSYYSLNTNSSWVNALDGPHVHMLTLYVNCTSPQASYQKIGTYSTTYKVQEKYYFILTNSAGTVILGYLGTDGSIYVYGGYAGHGFKGTIIYLSSN